jgi:hypothetical protein
MPPESHREASWHAKELEPLHKEPQTVLCAISASILYVERMISDISEIVQYQSLHLWGICFWIYFLSLHLLNQKEIPLLYNIYYIWFLTKYFV